MHTARAAIATSACSATSITSASGTATAAAALAIAFVACPLDVSRTVQRRQQASRPLPAAIAYDKTNEARHVA